MARIYDDAQEHRRDLPGDLPRKAGATHLGMFFAWCLQRDLLSEWHTHRHPEEIERLGRRWYSGRDYLLQFMDGRLDDEHLSAAGQAFAEAYLASGRYLADYEATLGRGLSSLYHVSDTWENYERLVPVIERAWAAAEGTALVSVAPSEPEPEPVQEPEPELHSEPDAHVESTPAEEPEAPAEFSTSEPHWGLDPMAPAPPEIQPEPEAEPEPVMPVAGEPRSEPEADLPAEVAADYETRDETRDETREETQAGEDGESFELTDAEAAWSWEDAMGRLERSGSHPPQLPPDLPPESARVRQSLRGSIGQSSSSATTSKWAWRWIAVFIFLSMYGCTQCATRAVSFDAVEEGEAPRSRTRPQSRGERLATLERERHAKIHEAARQVALAEARAQRERLPDVPWGLLSRAQAAEANERRLPAQFENRLKMRFALLPSGSFQMGSPSTEKERDEGEVEHAVVLTKPVYMQIAEVTNGQFRRFRAQHQSDSPRGLKGFDGALRPVTSVGWQSAMDFCAWLTREDSKYVYRLPTEAEWEYACRADSTGRFPWGDDEGAMGRFANVADRTARDTMPRRLRQDAEATPGWRWAATNDKHLTPSPVGSFRANAWGLYDMIGNVFEWCSDWAAPYDLTVSRDPRGADEGELRVIRGGAADAAVYQCRSAWRGGMRPVRSAPNVGFRCVAEVVER